MSKKSHKEDIRVEDWFPRPKSTTLQHLIEVEIRTTQQREIRATSAYVKARERGEVFEGLEHYNSESEIILSIDGKRIARCVGLQSMERDVDRDYLRKLNYFRKHLRNELERAVLSLSDEVSDLYADPGPLVVDRNTAKDTRGKKPRTAREIVIAKRLAADEAAARQRIPHDQRRISPEEEWDFITKAEVALRELVEDARNDGASSVAEVTKKLTKTNLARKLFPDSDNLLQALKRQFNQMRSLSDFDDLLLHTGLHPHQLRDPKHALRRRFKVNKVKTENAKRP